MDDHLRRSGERFAVHLEREFAASPTDLFAAWTEPDQLARWLGVPSGPVLDQSGPVRLTMGDDENDWVDISLSSAIPAQLLEFSWKFSGEPAGLLRVTLDPVSNEDTRLVLDHDGLDASAAGYGAGWQAFLEGPLTDLLTAGARASTPVPETPWDTRFTNALPNWRLRRSALS